MRLRIYVVLRAQVTCLDWWLQTSSYFY